MNYELIKYIYLELGIDENCEEFKDILDFYENTKRIPNKAEVDFVRVAMKKARENAKSKVRLLEAECSSEDFRELLSGFISRYNSAASSRELPLVTDLAEYAATGKTRLEECGIFIEPANARTFPTPYSGSSERHAVGDLILTLSYGKPIGGNFAGDICAILSPAEGQPIDDFIEKSKNICRDFAKNHPQTVIKAATDDGLLSDLAFLSNGYVIDTRLLPSPSETADAIFGVRSPSLLLFPKREDLHELWMIAACYGITPTAPIASRAKFITVRSAEASIEFTSNELNHFSKTRDICLKSNDSPALTGEEEYLLADHELTYSGNLLTAAKLGGDNIYESLKDFMKDSNAVYAISGILSENDPSTLPLIITIDSFRRNKSPNVLYSSFFMGKTTSVYVFKLSKKN